MPIIHTFLPPIDLECDDDAECRFAVALNKGRENVGIKAAGSSFLLQIHFQLGIEKSHGSALVDGQRQMDFFVEISQPQK